MQRHDGIAAAEGIAYGTARSLVPRLIVGERRVAQGEVAEELRRLEHGLEAADQELLVLSRELCAQAEGSALVEAHRLILRSDEIVQAVRTLVSGGRLAAESAVRKIVDKLVTQFDEMENVQFRERGADVAAVGERLVRTIVGAPAEGETTTAGTIGVGATLSPLDAFRLRDAGVTGVVTADGGKTSHLAIVLRALEIPYVAGVPHMDRGLQPGTMVIVDGGRGIVVVNPDAETLETFQRRRRQLAVQAQRRREIAPGPATTSDGTRLEMAANIDTLAEVAHAVEVGAESVGLVRTELLYLDRADLPSEEEQYHDAVDMLKALAGRAATFRTLDLGGDKLPLAVPVASGPNPSLGVRAIRFSARRPDIFRTQLRALYRASAVGPLRILFPMISGVAEMRAARQVASEVRAELDREGKPYDPHTPLGAMIETPSAALTVDHLADVSDFFSIGTNDLVQYTFAADRENQDVQYLHQPLHPAVLRLLKLAIDAAGRAGKPIALCGDMAGDPTYTWTLVGLGLRQLSMVPASMAAVRSVLAGISLVEAQALAAEALLLHSAPEVEELVAAALQRRFPDRGDEGD